METYILLGDITNLTTDAIVNSANGALSGGGGVDGKIHRAAGPELAVACKQYAPAKPGSVHFTPGYNLKAKHVLHAVGPVWQGRNFKEEELLYACYSESFRLAEELGATSIAFPAISTGAYRFPIPKAVSIALRATEDFRKKANNIQEVIHISLDRKVVEEFQRQNV